MKTRIAVAVLALVVTLVLAVAGYAAGYPLLKESGALALTGPTQGEAAP